MPFSVGLFLVLASILGDFLDCFLNPYIYLLLFHVPIRIVRLSPVGYLSVLSSSYVFFLGQEGEESRSAFKILTGKPTGKRPLGKPRHRWEDNITMDLEEIDINAGN